jgi:hypothetical protein
MVWDALGSALIGLAVAVAALRLRPERFPSPVLTVPTGPVGGLVGGLITRVVLGPGFAPATLVGALAVAVAALSLLVREPDARRSASGHPGLRVLGL